MQKSELEELERLHRAAEPAPWTWDRNPSLKISQGAYFTGLITLGDTYEGSETDCLLLERLRNNAAELLRSARLALLAETFLRDHINASKSDLDALRKEFGLG